MTLMQLAIAIMKDDLTRGEEKRTCMSVFHLKPLLVGFTCTVCLDSAVILGSVYNYITVDVF